MYMTFPISVGPTGHSKTYANLRQGGLGRLPPVRGQKDGKGPSVQQPGHGVSEA